jgi:hypothetical protein
MFRRKILPKPITVNQQLNETFSHLNIQMYVYINVGHIKLEHNSRACATDTLLKFENSFFRQPANEPKSLICTYIPSLMYLKFLASCDYGNLFSLVYGFLRIRCLKTGS